MSKDGNIEPGTMLALKEIDKKMILLLTWCSVAFFYACLSIILVAKDRNSTE